MNETYVTMSGNVVGAPQVRVTRGNVPFVTFRVASTVRRVDTKTGEYIDGGTNFVNVTAFRSLAANLANSLEKGAPVIVYGRMRINQWTHGERSGTTVEIDAYNVGFDMSRGLSTFRRVARAQLDQHDRLADPAVQEAQEALEGRYPGGDAGGPDQAGGAIADGERDAGYEGEDAFGPDEADGDGPEADSEGSVGHTPDSEDPDGALVGVGAFGG